MTAARQIGGHSPTPKQDWFPPTHPHPPWARHVFAFARRIELAKLALPPRTFPNFHKGLNEH